MKRLIFISVLFALFVSDCLADSNQIVRRLSSIEISQNQTPSSVAYNFIHAIYSRNYSKMTPYFESDFAHQNEDYMESLKRKYGNDNEASRAYFSSGEYAEALIWLPALNNGYEIVVESVEDLWLAKTDYGWMTHPQQFVKNGMVYIPGEKTPYVGIHEKRVTLICCHSLEINAVSFKSVSKYQNTQAQVILGEDKGNWRVKEFYFNKIDEDDQWESAKIETVEESVITEPSDERVYMVVDEMPEFLGGNEAMNRWLSKNIEYPLIAQKNNIQGRVVCQFIVNKDGRITDVQVIRGVDASLDAEAVRVISIMPNWKPGRHDGKNVNVKYTLPIRFHL